MWIRSWLTWEEALNMLQRWCVERGEESQALQPRVFQPPAVGKTQKCRGYSADGVVHTLSTLIFNRVLNAARYSSPIPMLTA